MPCLGGPPGSGPRMSGSPIGRDAAGQAVYSVYVKQSAPPARGATVLQ